MNAIIVRLDCITNMHVGNGDVNFNIIDNEVERDVVTGYPTINASGVKGALREYFVKNNLSDIDSIFGGEGAGKLKILSADMLAIPARASKGDCSYYLLTTDEAIEKLEEKCREFLESDIKPFVKKKVVGNENMAEGIKLENVITLCDKIVKKEKDEKEIYVITEEDFRSVPLPVIARNKLDNGKSKNLWYEEVVPHESIFTFGVLSEETEEDKELLNTFAEKIDNKIIQFGGSASIGYGLCKVSVIRGKKNEQKNN